MPVPTATGYPQYTTDVNNWPGSARIPILFSGKLLEKFYAKSTIANIATTDYVGELKNIGDRVVIRTTPNVTIRPYSKGATLQLEYPDSPAIEFTVNRAKYFNFAIDDIDIKQSDLNWLDKLANDAAQQIKITIDTEVFASIYTKADSNNQGANAGVKTHLYNLGAPGAPVILTVDNVVEKIIDCSTVLDEQNVPDEDRWIVLPPNIINLIDKTVLKKAMFTGAQGVDGILRGGFTGYGISKFAIFESNLLHTVIDGGNLCWYIPFGYKGSLVYVSQINKTEKYRPQNTFAEAMKGLIVYDFDVINPKGFGTLYATLG